MNHKNPWLNEPDEYHWVSKDTGYNCIWQRHDSLGHLCGYVLLPIGHPYFGKHYDDIPVDVHGGLTYSDMTDDGFWKVGFDCAHLGDLCPWGLFHNSGVYRDRNYVENETERLALQLKEVEKNS